MKVLSLFDGLSGCRIALDKIGIKPDTYYASEIDKYAIQVGQHNYPENIQLGDMTKWRDWDIDFSQIDLLTAGFPCQAWSLAGKQKGDTDPRGALVHDLIDIWKHITALNPNLKFMFENVKMKKEFIEYINNLFGVEPIEINSALVSAQNRKRLYWTNIPGVEQPRDLGILLGDIIEGGSVDRDKSLTVTTRVAGATAKRYLEKSMHQMVQERPCELREFNPNSLCHHVANATDLSGNDSIKRVYAETGKAPTLTTMGGGHREPKVLLRPATITGRRLNERGVRDDYNKDVPINQCLQVKHNPDKAPCLTTIEKDCLLSTMGPGRYPNAYTDSEVKRRKLTPLECERLQTLPDNYTLVLNNKGKQLVSNSQRYKMTGNGWTIDVVAHIFKGLKEAVNHELSEA